MFRNKFAWSDDSLEWWMRRYKRTVTLFFTCTFTFWHYFEDLFINRRSSSWWVVICFSWAVRSVQCTCLYDHTSPGFARIVFLCLLLCWRSGPSGDVVCQVFSEYARACAHADHPLHDWRQHIPPCGTFFQVFVTVCHGGPRGCTFKFLLNPTAAEFETLSLSTLLRNIKIELH